MLEKLQKIYFLLNLKDSRKTGEITITNKFYNVGSLDFMKSRQISLKPPSLFVNKFDFGPLGLFSVSFLLKKIYNLAMWFLIL